MKTLKSKLAILYFCIILSLTLIITITSTTNLYEMAYKLNHIIITMYILIIIFGFFISRFFINKFLKPIYSLNETIKSIKEGNLNIKVPVLYKDEFGDMIYEFNKMTKRLMEYENSTKGQLMMEKNKSLAIVKSISDPLVVLNTNYKFTISNTAFEELFNINEKDILNKYFLEIIPNKYLYNHISSVLNENDDINNCKIIEFQLNKEHFYFNVITTLVKDIYSNISGIIILFQNITELKKLEKMKEDFISTISHEFKTPLTSIMIGTSLIVDENIGVLNDKQRNIINTMRDDVERLSELVTDLLQLSKLQSDSTIFNFRDCSIVGIIETCVKNFYQRSESIEVNIYYEVDENLPRIKADGEKMSWVINNLISNALKYTNAGDEILVSAEVKYNKMQVSVKDTGIGIPEEYIEKIFDKFIQVIGSDSEIRGSGLGLTISKQIVEAHNGTIWCESEVDVGSTFTFTLPLTQ